MLIMHPPRSNIKENKKTILETLSQLQPKEEAIPGVAKASKYFKYFIKYITYFLKYTADEMASKAQTFYSVGLI